MLPGRAAQGKELEDGNRLSYRLNGLLSLAVTFGVLAALYLSGAVPGAVVYDHLGSLITVTILFSFAYSLFLYLRGRRVSAGRTGRERNGPRRTDARRTGEGRTGGVSGNVIYDFFMGTSRNPRIGSFDLKFFSEARPGLIGWVVINLSFMAAQHEANGAVSLSMILVVLMQGWYVVDYYLHERAILTTMDIAHERFGFMLAFGDLAWVPYMYTLQALYLVHDPVELPAWAAALIFALHLTGYGIFRAANNQKHRFRTDPGARIWGKEPQFIATDQGSRLLVSGFWGWSRHFNYVGDILMAVAWSLPTLFRTPLTYFYPVYFTILLIHRERRDDRLCGLKYGRDWERYRRRVPWRIVPGIY